jgi:hypothetical protein
MPDIRRELETLASMNRTIDLGLALLQLRLDVTPERADEFRDLIRRAEELKKQNTLVMNLLLMEEEARCRTLN